MINDCEDCIKNGGDWECDHIHCRKGENLDALLRKIKNCSDKHKLIRLVRKINNVLKTEAPEEWIPVEHKLPEANKKVLVTYRLGVTVATYNAENKKWSTQRVDNLRSVTAWRELPKPYKGE